MSRTPQYLLNAARALIADFKDTNPEELKFSGFKGLIKALRRAEQVKGAKCRLRRSKRR